MQLKAVSFIAPQDMRRAYDVGLPVKELKDFFAILKAVKKTGLEGFAGIKTAAELEEWEEQMDSVSYRLLSLYKNPHKLKGFASADEFLYKFLTNLRIALEDSVISAELERARKTDKKVADSLEFLWPLWMTLENVTPLVMEKVVANISYVNGAYKGIIGFKPEADSAVQFNEAVNVCLTGEYGKYLIGQKTQYQSRGRSPPGGPTIS